MKYDFNELTKRLKQINFGFDGQSCMIPKEDGTISLEDAYKHQVRDNMSTINSIYDRVPKELADKYVRFNKVLTDCLHSLLYKTVPESSLEDIRFAYDWQHDDVQKDLQRTDSKALHISCPKCFAQQKQIENWLYQALKSSLIMHKTK